MITYPRKNQKKMRALTASDNNKEKEEEAILLKEREEQGSSGILGMCGSSDTGQEICALCWRV